MNRRSFIASLIGAPIVLGGQTAAPYEWSCFDRETCQFRDDRFADYTGCLYLPDGTMIDVFQGLIVAVVHVPPSWRKRGVA